MYFKEKKFKLIINNFINKNIKHYDYVYLTADLRGFLKNYYEIKPEKICGILISSFLKKNITVIIPAFTFTNNGKFYIDRTQSNLGYLTKWFLKQKKIIRSEHPIFSVCAIGKNAKIVKNIGKSAFGIDSIFDRLRVKRTSLIHFGRPFNFGNTVIHYVEQLCGAFYRKNKIFYTKVYRNKKYIGSHYSAFVRLNEKKFISNKKKIGKIFKNKKLLNQIGSEKNLTNITHIDYKKAIKLMTNSYYKNNKIFI